MKSGDVSFRRPQMLGVAAALAIAAVSAATPAMAYVGPGAGLTLIGSLVAVVAAAVLALLGLVLFPIRMALKSLRAAKEAREQAAAVPDVDPS